MRFRMAVWSSGWPLATFAVEPKIKNVMSTEIYQIVWGVSSSLLVAFGVYCIAISVRHELRKMFK